MVLQDGTGAGSPPPASPAPFTAAAHGELLQREIGVHLRIRWSTAALLLAGGWLLAPLDPVWAARAPWLSGVGLAVALYNGVLTAVRAALGERTGSPGGFDPILRLFYAAVVLDFIALALVVALLGGVRSPFMAVFFLHLALGCFLYPPRAARILLLLLVLLIGGQAVLEVRQLDPATLILPGRAAPYGPLAVGAAVEVVAVYVVVATALAALLIPTARWLRDTQVTLQRQRDALERSARMRRDFLRLAVHNLRSPLAASMMHLDNLERGRGGALSARQEEWLGRIRRRLTGLLDTMDGLQALGAADFSDLASQAETVDVDELLAEVVEDHRVGAEARGLTFIVNAGPGLRISAVPVLVREAVVNYVENAVKHASAPAAVEVRGRRREAGDGVFVRVEVEDEGPGIAEADRDRIFDEFVRLGPPGSGGTPGTGLGLALVRRIARAHGGDAGVEAGRRGGAVFWIEFPTLDGPWGLFTQRS